MREHIDENLLLMKINGRSLDISSDYYNGKLIFTEKNIDSICINNIDVMTVFSKKASIEFNVKIVKDTYCFEVPVSMILKYDEKNESGWEVTNGTFRNDITMYILE